MIDELKKNIETEINIAKEMAVYVNKIGFANNDDKKILGGL